MLTKRQKAVEIMYHLVTHDGDAGHGYSQGGNRWGDGTFETVTLSDGSKVQVANGDRDCSSGYIDAWQRAGVDCGGATYTGNIIPCMVGTGNFVVKPASFIAEPGDAYLNVKDHVAMCLQQVPDRLMEFSINEFGKITGGRQGDQTGRESAVNGFYDYPWDYIVHYVGGDSPAPAPTPSASVPDVRYRVRTAGGWLPEMAGHYDPSGSGDDFAGILGQPITYIAISMSGWYQAYTRASGWLPPVGGYDVGDLENGCAGDGSPILAVRCYYETQHPEATGWLAVEYQVHAIGGGWYDSMVDLADTGGSGDNYAGDMDRAIDGFRARLIAV